LQTPQGLPMGPKSRADAAEQDQFRLAMDKLASLID
jgi:hypothetical protein